MTVPPTSPRIYHITHVANLPGIVADGGLLSDAAMRARGGPATSIEEGKQAEFLVLGSFPWSLVSQIGVFDQTMAAQTSTAIARASHQPTVSVQRSWYF